MDTIIKKEIRTLVLSDVKDFPGNPQKVTTEKLKIMTTYMKNKGWVGQMPLAWLCSEDGNIYWISGHHRAKAAILAGITERKCEVIVDESYGWTEAKKDLLMYNNVHGNPDTEMETNVIEDLLEDDELENIANDIGLTVDEAIKKMEEGEPKDIGDKIGSIFEVVVECDDYEQQEEVFNSLKEKGLKCRILTL